MDLRADALRLHLTLQDDPHYAERRQAVLRRKVEQCADTFRGLLDRNPLTAFREPLQRELRKVGLVEFLPRGLADAAARVSRTLGAGRGLENTLRTLDTIVDEGVAPVRSRMEQWVSEFEASAAASREESIVFYREWDSQRTLRAYHTRDLRLQRAPV